MNTIDQSKAPFNAATNAQQFALLVDSVREYAMFMLDADGRIRTWNPGAQRIKGYAPDEILGKHYSVMFTPEDQVARKPWNLLERAKQDGSCRDEGWRLRKDGTKFWASVVLTAIHDQAGNLTGFAKVSRDETERHELEEKIRLHARELETAVEERTRELRRANAELEQFNYITSHDLQEPIRMVGMFVQKLMESGDSLSKEQRQRYMRFVLEGSERMRALVDDLLLYSRIDRDSALNGTIDSGQAARAAVDNLAQLVARRSADVKIGDLPSIRASQPQLIQLFQNLIENAIKYGPPQKPTVVISARERAGAWEFAVQDNGIGIEPQFHEKIFVVFQRLHGREAYPGTGMGLAICKKIVENHGGKIWVVSAPTAGSTFHFTIPKA